ncbi:hypothetical protein CC78DRAFT_586040 [Lojkania enalia]|uniref:Uncharacterized protein n=1 Tax=Lojkania enalia TaxID=147567 RepID=A0A9P4N5F9_9PLEO|nr:hypothetical protein CC78DRAFT_586040 [Didymosphaeria enalia]
MWEKGFAGLGRGIVTNDSWARTCHGTRDRPVKRRETKQPTTFDSIANVPNTPRPDDAPFFKLRARRLPPSPTTQNCVAPGQERNRTSPAVHLVPREYSRQEEDATKTATQANKQLHRDPVILIVSSWSLNNPSPTLPGQSKEVLRDLKQANEVDALLTRSFEIVSSRIYSFYDNGSTVEETAEVLSSVLYKAENFAMEGSEGAICVLQDHFPRYEHELFDDACKGKTAYG